MKFLQHLKTAQGLIQILGVIVSSVISGITALQLGGDPVIGAAIGSGVNALFATDQVATLISGMKGGA